MLTAQQQDIEFAIEVFVHGHSAGKSRTFPYAAQRIERLWVMRDAPRKNPRDYRKEEWIAHAMDPRDAHAIARRHSRGRFFIGAIVRDGEPDAAIRSAYRSLGYRLLATEGFFLQRLKRIPRPASQVLIKRVRTSELATRLGQATRSRPTPRPFLAEEAPSRRNVALPGEDLVGRFRRAEAGGALGAAASH